MLRHMGRGLPTPPTPGPYPLSDNGTLAAMFGRSHAPANAPDYARVDYTYTGAATGGAAVSLPAAASVFTSQAMSIAAGEKLYVEAEVLAVPSQFAGIELRSFQVSGGSVAGAGPEVGISNTDGLTPLVNWAGGGSAAQVAAAVGFRFGIVFDGSTGDVQIVSTDGIMGNVSGAFTPGNQIVVYLNIADAGVTPATETVSITLVPNAADMELPALLTWFPADVVDHRGNSCT